MGGAGYRCGLCGSSSLGYFVAFDGFDVRRCALCRSAMVVRQPMPGNVEDYAGRYGHDLTARKTDRCWTVLEEAGLARPGARLLDVGCGRGAFLDVAKTQGMSTSGLELAEDAARAARARGHRVVLGSATGEAWALGEADVITFWDVLEHLDEPGRALALAAGRLAPCGSLVILTPFIGSVWDVFGRFIFIVSGRRAAHLLRMCWSRDHLFRFDRDGLARQLERLGLTVQRSERLLLLSLEADRYAGGAVLGSWTGHATLDRLLSRAAVRLAQVLNVPNKLLIIARRDQT